VVDSIAKEGFGSRIDVDDDDDDNDDDDDDDGDHLTPISRSRLEVFILLPKVVIIITRPAGIR